MLGSVGSKISKIQAAAEEAGIDIPTPDYLEYLGEEAETAYTAFSALSAKRDRDEGGPKPISIEAIKCYIDLILRHYDEDEVEDLLYFLQVLDDRYLEIKAKSLEKTRKKAEGKRGSRGGRR